MCCEEKLRMLTPLGVLYVHRLICNWILYHVPLYYLSSCFKEAEDYEIMILKAPMYSIEISKIFTKQFYRRKLNWYFTKSFEKFICLLYNYVYTITMEPQHWWLWIFFQSEGQKVSGIYIKSVVPGGAAALVSINNSSTTQKGTGVLQGSFLFALLSAYEFDTLGN